MQDIKTLSNQFRLDAIAWKCQQIGLSYGQLMNTYRNAEIQQVYEEFKKVVIARRQKNSLTAKQDKDVHSEQP